MLCLPQTRHILALTLLAAPLCAPSRARADGQPAPETIVASMRQVADWQLSAPLKSKITIDAWESGAFYTGVMALGDLVADPVYHDAMTKIGAGQQWKTKPGVYNPDNYVIGQTYLELYFRKHDPQMIAPLRDQFDGILAQPIDDDLDLRVPGHGKGNWSWCDTLFMGPPTWVRMAAATGEAKYLDFAIRNWWVTSAYLYDKDEHLYYRDSRFFDLKGPAGEKMFWSRGNSWVVAGLARVLQFLPENHPDRPRFVQQFRELTDKVLTLQQPDGSWHPSLLNAGAPDQAEASGTGFFIYGLVWGVNHGLLDRAKFTPAIWKGWGALTSFVEQDGRLAHTQSSGDRPVRFDPGNNDSFGAGAFLLAGSEVYRLALLGDAPRVSLEATSKLDAWRENETIEVPWRDLLARFPGAEPADLAVVPDRHATVLVSQVLDGQGSLLFQSDFAPRQFQRFDLVLKKGLPKPEPAARSYARFVPERMDDFAWENERTAHRMYGPALQRTGEISSGVDLWSKRSHKALIDQWYQRGDYHADHGDGGDFYKTGPTRGCGGLGIWIGGKLVVSKNFTRWQVLANGPIRSEFRLEYAPCDAGGGTTVTEAKVISLDTGSNLNRFSSEFTVDGPVPAEGLPVGIGITRRPGEGGFTDRLADGWMSYWSPADPGNGDVGCAVVLPPPTVARAQDTADNYLAIVSVPADSSRRASLVYYAGGGWSKGDFPTRESWEQYVRDYSARLRSPLSVALFPPGGSKSDPDVP